MPDKYSLSVDKEKLPPSGLADFLVIVPIFKDDIRTDEERLYDKSERKFEIKVILSKNINFSNSADLEVDETTGASFFNFPIDAEKLIIKNKYGEFLGTKNRDNEISAVKGAITTTDWGNAVRMFIDEIVPMLDYLSYIANTPVLINNIYCNDTKNNVEVFGYTVPYSAVTINAHIDELPEELIPIFALYREAKNNNSLYYRFLCYYKILEGVLINIRPKLFSKLRNQGIQFKKLEELVPSHKELSEEHKKLIGKKIQVVFEGYLTNKYRNVIAHFIVKDGRVLNVSEFHSNTEFSSALLIIELCARKVLENQLVYSKLKSI